MRGTNSSSSSGNAESKAVGAPAAAKATNAATVSNSLSTAAAAPDAASAAAGTQHGMGSSPGAVLVGTSTAAAQNQHGFEAGKQQVLCAKGSQQHAALATVDYKQSLKAHQNKAAAALKNSPAALAAGFSPLSAAAAAPGGRAQPRKIAALGAVQAVVVPPLPSTTPAAPPSSSSSTGLNSSGSFGKGSQSSSSCSSSSSAGVRSAAAGPVHMWSFLEQIQVEAQQQQQRVGSPSCQHVPGAAPTATTSRAAAAAPVLVGGQALREKSKNALGSRWLCVICMYEPRGVVLLPCRHLVLCRGCSARVEAQGSGCPLCQQVVEKHLVVHRS